MAQGDRTISGRHSGGLLLAAAASLGAAALPGASAATETIGFALLGSAVATFTEVNVRGRRFATPLLLLVLLAVGDRLADWATRLDHPWAVPVALGSYLLWTSAIGTPRAVARGAIGSLAAIAVPLGLRIGFNEAALLAAPIVPITMLAAVVAVLRAHGDAVDEELARQQADLDAVLMANIELRNVAEARDAAQRIARVATELLGADGAVVWLRGPGRLLCAGGHGTTPPPEHEVTDGSAIDRVLTTGSITADADGTVLPLTASGGVFGAVAVSGATRPVEPFVTSVLQVFGAQAGYALERLRAVEDLTDSRYVDPVTGVGNRLAATASLATLSSGDAVLLLALDDMEGLRAREGDARADLVLGQLGLHLRTATRAGDLVARFSDDVFFVLLRDLNTGTETVVARLLDSWQRHGSTGWLRAGAAVRGPDCTPLETLDRATEALDSARGVTAPVAAGAEHAIWGSAPD